MQMDVGAIKQLIEKRRAREESSCLCETDGSRLFTEALTAKVKTVLADETSLVSTETALSAALSVLTRAREPNSVVGHGKF